MRKRAKKLIYILGSIGVSVIIFLSGILFIYSPLATASPQQQNSGGNTELGNGSNGDGGIGSTEGSGEGAGESGLGGGPEGNGGGNGDGGGGAQLPTHETYLFRIHSQKSETVYLREENKGDYTGKGYHGFNEGYTYQTSAGEIDPSEYFAYALQNSGITSHYIKLELKADLDRFYPYYNNKIYESDAGIMQYRAKAFDYIYDANTMPQNSFSSIQPEYAEWEDDYYEFVKDTYLSIPNKLKNVLLDLAQENHLDKNAPTIISDVADYIQNAATYDYYYAAQSYPDDKDMVTYFLTEHKRGVCRHYAAAATMMFRALGIPARYTRGYRVEVQANEWRIYGDEPMEEGHAWPEVYLQGYGWVAIEVTGGNTGGGGNGPATKDVIKVTTGDMQKVYDGTPLSQIPTIQAALLEGHKIVYSYLPSLTNVGSIPNQPIIRIVDENGKDCTAEANITYDCGTLTVTPREITLTTGSKTASGVESLTCEEYTIGGAGLAENDSIYISNLQFAKLDNPGVCTNTISYKSLMIKNNYGGDVTDNYIITIIYGVLILMP